MGGKPGAPGQFVLNPGTSGKRVMKSKGLDPLQAGDVVSLRLPGAGGYGDPQERDPNLLRKDVRDGKVTEARARQDYGLDETDQKPEVHGVQRPK